MNWRNVLAIGSALLITAVGATAQMGTPPDPPPPDPMTQMVKIMQDIQAEMQMQQPVPPASRPR